MPSSEKRVKEELDLIAALFMLSELKVSILPLQGKVDREGGRRG